MAGRCGSFGLSGVSFAIPRKDVMKLVNRGKTKGDAAVGLVANIIGGSTNSVGVLGGSASDGSVRGGAGRRLNIMFSKDGFPMSLSTGRLGGILGGVCSD